jgi:cellulose synthase/poly-beta-1,6-N-acetylglucosamine synthase-like glycosyltransferase
MSSPTPRATADSAGIRTVLSLIVGGAGVLVSAPAIYLAALSIAAVSGPVPGGDGTGRPPQLAVLVPAHNEEELLGRCLESLADQDYPDESYSVIVIADNCTDRTADVARSNGVQVLERHDLQLRGKGHALRWAMDLLGNDSDLDAFVVVDADSIAERGLLSGLAKAVGRGAEVAQADYAALLDSEEAPAQLRGLAFLLFHRVRFSGKARLGLPCSLVGNGMLVAREVSRRHPWAAFSEVEDLEYSLQLRLAGVGPVFAPSARLAAPVATAGAAAEVQRRRWEGGRARVTARYLPQFASAALRQRRWRLWDVLADLAVPPLGVLATASATGAGITLGLAVLGAVPAWAALPWAGAVGGLAVHVLLGLRLSDDPGKLAQALAAAPRLLLADMATRIRMDLSAPAGERWVRTPRDSGAGVPAVRTRLRAAVSAERAAESL